MYHVRGDPKHLFRAFASALLILVVTAVSVAAQEETAAPDPSEESEASEDIDEMVVLASGRDDFLKEMSVSVTTFSASEIKSLRIQNIADLAGYTPNVEINTRSSASNPTLFIRGIGLKDYNANAASAVAVYQDGININAPAIQLGQLFDVEEVSILRGPQGSLNGRNATAGAIMFNSVLPDGAYDASASLTVGNFNAYQVEGALAFPVVENLLSTRMAFTANFRDGTTENHCANWDPESINMPRLTEQTIRDAWVANGSPTDRIRFPRVDTASRETDNGNSVFHPTDPGRRLNPDGACIINDPGWLTFKGPDPNKPEWKANIVSVPKLDEFQGLNKNLNNVNNWAARMIWRWQPDVNDGMDWVLNFHGGQNDSDSAHLQALRTEFKLGTPGKVPIFKEALLPGDVTSGLVTGLEGQRTVKGVFTSDSSFTNQIPGGRGGDDVDSGFYDSDGDETLDSYGISLNVRWDTGPVLVTSLTGYENYDRRIEDEGDASPERLFPAIFEDNAFQVSQELRVRGEGELYHWSVGGFILHENLNASNLFPGIRTQRIEQRFHQELTSGAVYAGGRYWLLDEIYFDGGMRINQEQKKFSLRSLINATAGGSNIAIPEEEVQKTWTGVTGDALVAWEPSGDWMYDARLDSLNLYVKYSRGMKGGHFNAGLTILQPRGAEQRLEPVDPEFIDAIEVGFRSSWLQNRLSMNFAFFRYWYRDLQVFDFENEVGALPVQKLLNSDAEVLGAELELMARPLPGLMLQLSVGWLDTEFKDFKVSKATNVPRGQGPLREFDFSGNPLISAPEWSLSGIAEYTIGLFKLGTLVPHYDVRYRDRVYLDPQKLDPISQKPFWIHNARLSYRTRDGRIEVAGWVENFMDKRYKIDVFDLSLDTNTILEVWNEPRLYGVTFTLSF